jgi:CheY-like chemotaxis protein
MNTSLLKKHYFLWADDDLDDLMLMRDALETFDQEHKIIEAHNGREVLNYLDQVKDPSLYPCLIILDMNMPILDGRETLKLLKDEQKYTSIPVVMFTTSTSEVDRMFCRRYAVEILTKPNSFKEYLSTIRQLLSFCRIATEKAIPKAHR